MEFIDQDDLLRELLLNMNIIPIIKLLQSSKKVNKKIINMLHELIPLIVKNVNYKDVEVLIVYLLSIGDFILAAKVYKLYRTNFTEADKKISDIIYYNEFFELFITIAPPDFDWYYVIEGIDNYIIGDELDENIINYILIPALNAKIIDVVHFFVVFWENNRDNYVDLQEIMDPLIEKGINIIS